MSGQRTDREILRELGRRKFDIGISVELVAPSMPEPSFNHWSAGAGTPETSTEKITAAPAIAVCDCGAAAKVGAVGAALTVICAALLVAVPSELVIVTV